MRDQLRIRVVPRQQRRRVPQRNQAGRSKDSHLGMHAIFRTMYQANIVVEVV